MASTLARALLGAGSLAAPLLAQAVDSPARLWDDEYSIEGRPVAMRYIEPAFSTNP